MAMRGTRRWLSLAAGLACLGAPAHGGPPGPEVIYINGVVRALVDEAALPAQALAVDEGRIVAVGSTAAILPLAAAHTRVIDLAGFTLMPGFVDAHTHVFNDAPRHGWTLEEAQQKALAAGITSLGNLYADPDFVAEMQAFESAGKLRVRTSLYLAYNDPCGEVLGNWYRDHTPNRDPLARLRLLGLKVFADGGVCNRPALTFPYAEPPDPDHPQGHLYFTTGELLTVLVDAQGAGWQVAVHTIGDRARDTVLDAFAALLGGGLNVNRHRLEHNTIIRPDQVARYGILGVIPVVWGRSSTCRELGPDGWRDELGPTRWDWYRPWRSLLASNPGLPVAWHMDVHGHTIDVEGELNTFGHVYGVATRRERRADGSVCLPTLDMSLQRVGVWQALRMMTSGAAYALHQDSVLGTLTVGKQADLIVVSADPLTVDPNTLDGLRVLSTVVGGRTEYCAPGAEAVCGP